MTFSIGSRTMKADSQMNPTASKPVHLPVALVRVVVPLAVAVPLAFASAHVEEQAGYKKMTQTTTAVRYPQHD